MNSFRDGLKNFLSSFANERAATNTNDFVESNPLGRNQLRAVYKLGVMSKIYRLMTGYALNDSIVFDSDKDKEVFEKKLLKPLRKAAMFQLGFGRGIILINEIGADLSRPARGGVSLSRVKFDVFSGDEVTAIDVDLDLSSLRYKKPNKYSVNGFEFHHSRVIDLTYYDPIENEKSDYNYGGISLPELIYNQLINDSVIERASGSIIEKNATIFYRVKGFKEAIRNKQEKPMLQYFSRLEDARSIHGAGLLDDEDSIAEVTQSLTNLSEVNDISLRRLAMVTGIPLPMLVGENVKGLNSSGDTERDTLNDTIKSYQDLYLIDAVNDMCSKLGLGLVSFKESIGMNSQEQASYESKVIDNAVKLAQMGEDGEKYLEGKGVITKDPFDKMFPQEKDEKELNDLFSLGGEYENNIAE